jgi:hypothetical protein
VAGEIALDPRCVLAPGCGFVAHVFSLQALKITDSEFTTKYIKKQGKSEGLGRLKVES